MRPKKKPVGTVASPDVEMMYSALGHQGHQRRQRKGDRKRVAVGTVDTGDGRVTVVHERDMVLETEFGESTCSHRHHWRSHTVMSQYQSNMS
jgi:hypothetical protein